MKIKCIILTLAASLALALSAQPTQQQHEWQWYLDEVVSETFVGRNYFEYYYQPSAADMEQQRANGEVNYFLNSPAGLNSKKVRDMIDRLMASYDDVKATGDWHMTSTTYWKEFRYEKNKFRFSVKRKALDDGTYYVSVTETASYYKSMAGKGKQKQEETTSEQGSKTASKDRPTKRSTRDRKPVVVPDNEVDIPEEAVDEEEQQAPTLSAKEQRKLEAQQREQQRREQRAKQRREQEQQREQAKAQKEAEKLKKAEAKKLRQQEERARKEEERARKEEERARKQEEKRQREQQRQQQAEKRQQQAVTTQQQTAPPPTTGYHHDDVALWLSEKYDFTQTAMTDNGCTMYSTAVKDVEMAKLAIKNALKGSDARMAVPWRLNSQTQAIETGYTVGDHVLVFTIGKDDAGHTTITVTEVSNEQFELFKQSLGNH